MEGWGGERKGNAKAFLSLSFCSRSRCLPLLHCHSPYLFTHSLQCSVVLGSGNSVISPGPYSPRWWKQLSPRFLISR